MVKLLSRKMNSSAKTFQTVIGWKLRMLPTLWIPVQRLSPGALLQTGTKQSVMKILLNTNRLSKGKVSSRICRHFTDPISRGYVLGSGPPFRKASSPSVQKSSLMRQKYTLEKISKCRSMNLIPVEPRHHNTAVLGVQHLPRQL